LRPDPRGGDALPGGGRCPPRRARRGVRDGHRGRPHQPGVLEHRQRRADGAPRVSLLLLAGVVPLAFALVAFVTPSERVRPWLLLAAAVCQIPVAALVLSSRETLAPIAGSWIGLDPLGALVVGYLSALFLCCAPYAPPYLRLRRERPNRIFCTMLLVFFAMMNFFLVSQHVGLMWVTIEAMTLSTGPLLYFNRNRRSIEATWKHLLIGSVGIAPAL